MKRPRTYRFSELWSDDGRPAAENATAEQRLRLRMNRPGRPRKHIRLSAEALADAVLDALRVGVSHQRVAEILEVPVSVVTDLELDR